MHRIDNPSAATALPTPKPLGPEGYFTAGNVNVGQSATIVEYDWLNTLQEELMNIILRGGLTSDKADNSQVLKALSNLLNSPTVQLTTSQSLLVPPYATQIAFRMVGAGGGGAHAQTLGTNYRSGAGGGSGAYAEAQRAVTPGSTLTAVVGVGGGNEAGGGATSLAFPTHWTVTAGGGLAGIYSAPTNSPGGPGGAASGGDLNSNGSFGGDGIAAGIYATTGYGGPGPWGGGARAGNGGGAAGSGPGAGGAGSYDSSNSNTFYPGGTGSNGMIQYRWLP
jgi:hypothetical protein